MSLYRKSKIIGLHGIRKTPTIYCAYRTIRRCVVGWTLAAINAHHYKALALRVEDLNRCGHLRSGVLFMLSSLHVFCMNVQNSIIRIEWKAIIYEISCLNILFQNVFLNFRCVLMHLPTGENVFLLIVSSYYACVFIEFCAPHILLPCIPWNLHYLGEPQFDWNCPAYWIPRFHCLLTELW